jgi:hypothetical protein
MGQSILELWIFEQVRAARIQKESFSNKKVLA